MLGHKMLQTLSAEFESVDGSIRGTLANPRFGRLANFASGSVLEKLDASDPGKLGSVLREIRPSVVVNCVGMIKQRPAAADSVLTIQLNSMLPHFLAGIIAEWSGKLIHFSTDCVFSGERGDYSESDPSDAADLYGKSKYLGEALPANALVLRTSIIGRELANKVSLLEWFLSMRKGQVMGFRRAWWSGVTTNHLSGLVGDIIRTHPDLTGLYQVSSGKISKYDLLLLLRDAYSIDVEIKADDAFFCDRSLLGERLRTAIGYECPSWPELLTQLVNDPTEYDGYK